MMSLYQYFSDYSKPATQFRCADQSFDYGRSANALQWLPRNQMKQGSARENDSSHPGDITELPQFEQEEILSWYQTVPLNHETYPQDFDKNTTMIQELHRKERLLTERQKRFRTSFTTCQLGRLEEEFEKDKYAVGMKRLRLARELGLSEKQIKVWYQNRRMKYKRVCQRIHNKRMAAVNCSYW